MQRVYGIALCLCLGAAAGGWAYRGWKNSLVRGELQELLARLERLPENQPDESRTDRPLPSSNALPTQRPDPMGEIVQIRNEIVAEKETSEELLHEIAIGKTLAGNSAKLDAFREKLNALPTATASLIGLPREALKREVEQLEESERTANLLHGPETGPDVLTESLAHAVGLSTEQQNRIQAFLQERMNKSGKAHWDFFKGIITQAQLEKETRSYQDLMEVGIRSLLAVEQEEKYEAWKNQVPWFFGRGPQLGNAPSPGPFVPDGSMPPPPPGPSGPIPQ